MTINFDKQFAQKNIEHSKFPVLLFFSTKNYICFTALICLYLKKVHSEML